MKIYKTLFFTFLLTLFIPIFAQDDDVSPDCLPENLAQQQATFAKFLTLDFEAGSKQATANLFRLGAVYQEMALRCGYIPNEPEVDVLIEQVLEYSSLDALIQAQSVGNDVETILIELEDLIGDPLVGQLLYNGLEPALGGALLGCSGCHENGDVAPPTEGTWTRVNDTYLLLPDFEDYTVKQYLVESIVHPEIYIVPPYQAVMPNIYSTQLTPQQLADIVTYLDSQDQLLED
jgi:hypothetical protein